MNLDLQELVLGSVEDEIDMEALEAATTDQLPNGAHFMNKLQLLEQRWKHELSLKLGGRDVFVAQKLMVSLGWGSCSGLVSTMRPRQRIWDCPIQTVIVFGLPTPTIHLSGASLHCRLPFLAG